MAGITMEKIAVDYCLKLPDKDRQGMCLDDVAVYAADICPKKHTSVCEMKKKAPRQKEAAEAYERLTKLISGKWKEAYPTPAASSDEPPENPSVPSGPKSPTGR